MTKPIIRAENLGKMYRIGHSTRSYQTIREQIIQLPARLIGKGKREQEEFWALKNINFEIEKGDRVGIIGRNGAGKSTLLKLLCRITKPTQGRAVINGRIASLLEVGTGFHPELTGKENIFMNGALLGMSRQEIKRKFDEIVDFAEVEKFIDTPVKRYSSGMYVRLAFAVAAHLEPEILLVDEVLAVGDVQFQKKCLGKMEDVSKGQGRTVLFVSHNMAAVQQLCKKGIVFQNGKLIFDGNVNDAIDKYTNSTRQINSIDKDGYIDLSLRREKNYVSELLKKIRVVGSDGKPSDTFKVLDAIRIEVYLDGLENFPDTQFGLGISSLYGQRITTVASWMFPEKVFPAKKIEYFIPSLQYVPGMYTIMVCVTSSTDGWIDKIENAITINITSRDVFGTGHEFTKDFGVVLPDGKVNFYK